MKQTQYKLEDFKVGQKVKVLVDLGEYVSAQRFSRIDEVGEVIEIVERDHSVRVKFDRNIQDMNFNCDHNEQWYRAEEIQPAITTNAERRAEIYLLEKQRMDISIRIQDLEEEIHNNPEKIKAEAGDSVKFFYPALLGERLMFIMQKEQAVFFDPNVEHYKGNFVFVGPDSARNSVDSVINGSWTKLELRKKNNYKWIDNSEVDWSDILKVAS